MNNKKKRLVFLGLAVIYFLLPVTHAEGALVDNIAEAAFTYFSNPKKTIIKEV